MSNPKKIMHVMAEFTYDIGVPTTGGRIACIFKRFLKDTNNVVIIIKQELPLKKVLEEDIPPIIRAPNLFSIFRELCRFKPDILIIHQYFGTPFQMFLQIIAKLMQIKMIIGPDLADEHAPQFKSRSISRLFKDTLLFVSMSLQMSLADKIYCQTNNEVDLLLRMPVSMQKLVTIPVPLPHGFKIGKSRKKDNYILAVSGWWSDRKNLHTALQVFSEVIKHRRCYFLVVGEFHKGKYKIIDEKTGLYTDKYETGEEYKSKIMKLINRLKLKPYVKFLGNVESQEELKNLYRKALIYYMPSKSEGFGSAFVEAMASGTPSVAMPKAAVRYIIKDGITGFLREPPESQKAAILELLTNKKLYRRMQKNCLAEAKSYTEESVGRKWKKLLTETNA